MHSTPRGPPSCSRTRPRALTHHSRDVPDSILRLVPANGGIVMGNFNPGFVSEEGRGYEDSIGPPARARQAAGTDSAALRDSVKAWRGPAPQGPRPHVGGH